MSKMFSYSEFNDYPKNSCAIRAVHIATGVPHDKLLAIAYEIITKKKLERSGTNHYELLKVLKALGVEYEDISVFKFRRDNLPMVDRTRYRRTWKESVHYRDYQKLSESLFRRLFPEGTYIVSNKDHAWTVIDGVTHDPNFNNNQKGKRIITDVIRILSK